MTGLRPDQCLRLEAQVLPEAENQATTLDIENQVLNTSSLREGTGSRLVWQENRALNHQSGKAQCSHFSMLLRILICTGFDCNLTGSCAN